LSTYNSKIARPQGGAYLIIGEDANGLPCIIATGQAANDGAIVAAIGADALWADGSLYISCVDGAGTIWQKRADTWTELTA